MLLAEDIREVVKSFGLESLKLDDLAISTSRAVCLSWSLRLLSRKKFTCTFTLLQLYFYRKICLRPGQLLDFRQFKS